MMDATSFTPSTRTVKLGDHEQYKKCGSIMMTMMRASQYSSRKMKQPLNKVALIGALLLLTIIQLSQVAMQQDAQISVQRNFAFRFAADEANTNDNQPSVPQEGEEIVSSGWRQQPAEVKNYNRQKDDSQQLYERVVLAGSNISINCPHFVGQFKRTAEWSEGFTLSAQTTSPNLSNEPLDHSRVKWFRNHVPLVNLNHLLYGWCDNKINQEGVPLPHTTVEVAQITTSATELNQTTELSPASGAIKSTSLQEEQVFSPAGLDDEAHEHRTSTDDKKQAASSEGPDFEITRENVNERTASARRRKGSNLQSSREEQRPRWCVNKFGELIINKVSTNLAGKYTCLGLGKQSDVFLHVVAVAAENDSESLVRRRHRRTFEDGHEMNEDLVERRRRRRPDAGLNNEQDTQPKSIPAALGHLGDDKDVAELIREAAPSPGSRQSVTGSELRTGTSAFPETGFSLSSSSLSSDKDHKSNKEILPRSLPSIEQSGGWRFVEKKKTKLMNQSADDEQLKEQEEDEDAESRSVKPSEMMITEQATLTLGAKEWNKSPIQSVRIESIQLDDLKTIPGLIYTKQKLRCPIWRSVKLRLEFTSNLAQTLCSQSDSSSEANLLYRHIKNCKDLVSDFLAQLDISRSSSNDGDDNCNTSILDLAWFKDGKQLQFHGGTGKAMAPEGQTANVRLINFCDQVGFSCDAGMEQKKLASSDKNGNSTDIEMLSAGDGPISKSSRRPPLNWFCPSIGRNLEIDGVRQDNAGHFSCAFRLNLVKLHRHILDMRHRLELQQLEQQQQQLQLLKSIPGRRHTLNISCCGSDKQNAKSASSELPAQPDDASTNANETATAAMAAATNEMAIPHESATVGGARSAEVELAASDRTGKASEPINGNEWLNLSKLIVKGLEAEGWRVTNHTEVEIERRDLMAVVQTFSLTVMERTAETCDLWSTISQASDAYSRRKWFNFRKLKQNRQQSSLTAPGQNDESLSSLSSSSSSLSSKHELKSSPSIEDAESPMRQMNANLGNSIGPIGTIVVDEQGRLLSFNSSEDNRLAPAASNGQSIEFINNSSSGSDGQPEQLEQKQQQQQLDDDRWQQLNNADEQKSVGGGLDIKPSAIEQQSALDKRRSSSGSSSISTSSGSSHGRYRRTIAHETPFNYANERLASKVRQGANKNGIMAGINGRQSELAKRSSAKEGSVDFSGARDGGYYYYYYYSNSRSHHTNGTDLLSSGEIKELITQIGRREASSGTTTNPSDDRANAPELLQQNESVSGPMDNEINGLTSSTTTTTAAAGGDETLRARQVAPIETHHTMMGTNDGRSDVITPASVRGPPTATTTTAGQWHRRRVRRSTGRQQDKLAKFQNSEDTGGREASDGLDDDLLWIAGQYLYMDVKAIAGSPLFGAEVSVEWSNERTNSSANHPFTLDELSLRAQDSEQKGKSSSLSEEHASRWPDYGRVRDASPFATIDVIAGQNLHLQCTAHALGRLPEVRWYKLIGDETLSGSMSRSQSGSARRIDGQLYWPLEDLDLLMMPYSLDEARAHSMRKDFHRDFVQSESTTLFNNLVNQTFTLVSHLQLSLDSSDNFGGRASLATSMDPSSSENVFACIVDADVRHDLATIGVNFPIDDSANRMPIEISKRLKAKALFEKGQTVTKEGKLRSREPRHLSEESTNPSDLIQMMDNDYRAAERSYWIALGNGSNLKKSQEFPTTATTLSILIVVMFSSLLGLVFLTLKSYQRLTSMQLEYSLDTYVGKETDDGGITIRDSDEYQSGNLIGHYMMIGEDEFNLVDQSPTRCTCQLPDHGSDYRDLAGFSGLQRGCLCSGYSSSQPETMPFAEQRQPLMRECWPLNRPSPHAGPYVVESDTNPKSVATSTVMIENPLVRSTPPVQHITSDQLIGVNKDHMITSV